MIEDIIDRKKDIAEVNTMSPLNWAYVGDNIFELYIRMKLVNNTRLKPHNLHIEAIKYVRASSQAKLLKKIEENLTDDEKDIFSQSDISDDELQFLNKFIQKKPNLKKELRPPEEPKEKSIVIEQTPFVTQKKQKYKPKRNFIKLAEAKRKDSGTKQSITRPIRQTRNRKTEEKDTLPTIKKSSIIKSAEKSKELQKMENLINNRQKNLFLLPSISRFNYLSQSNKVIRKYRYQT